MTEFLLPGPARNYPLILNLALIESIEQDMSLLQVAERLSSREIKLGDVTRLLVRFYVAAGCDIEPVALEEFILAHTPVALLADILVQILTPLRQMGAAVPGKPSTFA